LDPQYSKRRSFKKRVRKGKSFKKNTHSNHLEDTEQRHSAKLPLMDSQKIILQSKGNPIIIQVDEVENQNKENFSLKES